MDIISTDIPSRIDALKWSRWHLMVVTALGITWVLDGLEVTLASVVGVAIKDPRALGLTDAQVSLSNSWYLIGAVVGALVFGFATDRFGRKKLFFVTLAIYVSATGASAFSWNATSYFLFRFFTGAGIGGEYAAINSAIDELIPARLRGRIDLAINGTFWLGAVGGLLATTFLLNPDHFSVASGWRYAFGIGAILGVGILFLRNAVPESPRWLIIHNRVDEAERIVTAMEKTAGDAVPPSHNKARIQTRTHTPLKEVFHSMFVDHRRRSVLGLVLMVAQAFFYNAVGFFTYGLFLQKFYGVQAAGIGNYMLLFAVGNVLGPVVLGPLFDTVGRKKMIAATYGLSGILLAITGYLFKQHLLTATTQSAAFSVIFFVASCAASAAYLTVSEIFPLELRGLAISIFYAAGTLVGGAAAPYLFGRLIESGSRTNLFYGDLAAAGLMVAAAICEMIFGVAAEGKSLEDVATPLSAAGAGA